MRIGPAPAAIAALILSGCGDGYSDFRLPAPQGVETEVKFRWEPIAAPIIEGSPGDWDGEDALNPSIVQHKGRYFNFYSGFDGKTWHTGLATSSDGVKWTRGMKLFSPEPASWEGSYIAANGSALLLEDEFFYWYQAGGRAPRIGLARSPDGFKWQRQIKPVLESGPWGAWDERGVGDPFVTYAAGKFYMFYLGQDRGRRQRLGLAISSDGIAWKKLRSNPILDLGGDGAFDEEGLGEPAVWSSHGSWWMLYTGRDRGENRRIGLAISKDGRTWTRFSDRPVITGGQAWNAKVVCDPEVMVAADGVRVWFGGGDVARPDENIHGKIGQGLFRIITTTPKAVNPPQPANPSRGKKK